MAIPAFSVGEPWDFRTGTYVLSRRSGASGLGSVPARLGVFEVEPVEKGQDAPTQINVALNWTKELKNALCPSTRSRAGSELRCN
jgi:hypothetical protein